MPMRPTPDWSAQSGSITVIAVFFALTIAGLAVTMIETGLSARKMQYRADGKLYALEAAETGTARAEQEVLSQTDPDGDGIGSVFGWHAGGRYSVTATQDPVQTERYTLLAQGWHHQVTRRIETLVEIVPGGPWEYGIFTRDGMTFGSNGAATDAYDSRLGSYASQAVNVDAAGAFASDGGTIGSNGPIRLASQVTVRGDAHPGPGLSVEMTSNATVTGDTTPRDEPLDLQPTPYDEFRSASLVNDNLKWTTTSPVNYDPATMSLSVSGGATITLTGSTYFFSKLSLSGGAVLRIQGGPVKIYITDEAALGGGTIFNITAQPINLQFYQYPYALPAGYTPKTNKASISGGTNSAFVMYGPNTPITMSGNGEIMGALVASEFWMKGGGKIHFDLALRDQLPAGRPKLKRIYWRDVNPPLR